MWLNTNISGSSAFGTSFNKQKITLIQILKNLQVSQAYCTNYFKHKRQDNQKRMTKYIFFFCFFLHRFCFSFHSINYKQKKKKILVWDRFCISFLCLGFSRVIVSDFDFSVNFNSSVAMEFIMFILIVFLPHLWKRDTSQASGTLKERWISVNWFTRILENATIDDRIYFRGRSHLTINYTATDRSENKINKIVLREKL